MPGLRWASLTLCGLLLAGCGATRLDFAGQHRAAPPVSLSIYVSDSQLRLSPPRLGAGLVSLNVANQASKTERIVVTRAGGRTVARTGAIGASSSAELTVDFTRGRYELTARKVCPGCGPLASSSGPTRLTVGRARAAGDSALLQP